MVTISKKIGNFICIMATHILYDTLQVLKETTFIFHFIAKILQYVLSLKSEMSQPER